MGLEEKRKMKEYTDTIIPERTQELAEICDCPLSYEIEWDTFADDGEALRFLDNVAFHRINMAMRVICMDQLGKEAVKEGITAIKIRNVKTLDEMKLGFENKVLAIQGAFGKGIEGGFSDGLIRECLLKNL